MLDDVEYRSAVGDLVHTDGVRYPVRVAALYRSPVEYAALEIAGTRFTALTSTLTPAHQ